MSDAKWPPTPPLLLGRYQPRKLISRGGSALVFDGTDTTLGRVVAIKLFSAGTDLDQYREELRVLAGLSHHGIVSIVDAGIDTSTGSDPRPFLVMELIHGKSLRDTLRQGSLTLRQSAEIGYEVAEALDYVHSQGVIHRDISPSNVMLTDYGAVASRSRARITDFGIAIQANLMPTAGAPIVGTAAYVSPEQVRNEPLTPATDIYSLGLVMLECYTDSIAYPGGAAESAGLRLEHAPSVPKTIPRQWRGLLSRMTSDLAFDRPTASEVTTEIRGILRSRNW